LDVHTITDIRQTDVQRATPIINYLSPSEVETATANLKEYKSPGSDQISAELIQAGS
jgi:hypothetical protein